MKLRTIYRRRMVRRVALGLAVCAVLAPGAQGAFLHDGGGSATATVLPDDRAARPSGTVVAETAQRPDDRAVRPTAETSPAQAPAADNGLDWRVSVGIGLGALAMLMGAAAMLASRRRSTLQGA